MTRTNTSHTILLWETHEFLITLLLISDSCGYMHLHSIPIRLQENIAPQSSQQNLIVQKQERSLSHLAITH